MSETREIPPETMQPATEDNSEKMWFLDQDGKKQPFVPTRYNPEPGVIIDGLEEKDIREEEAAKLETELGAELRGLTEEDFQKRWEQVYRDEKSVRASIMPKLSEAEARGMPLDRDLYHILARAEELTKLVARIHNVRRGKPPEIFVPGGNQIRL